MLTKFMGNGKNDNVSFKDDFYGLLWSMYNAISILIANYTVRRKRESKITLIENLDKAYKPVYKSPLVIMNTRLHEHYEHQEQQDNNTLSSYCCSFSPVTLLCTLHYHSTSNINSRLHYPTFYIRAIDINAAECLISKANMLLFDCLRNEILEIKKRKEFALPLFIKVFLTCWFDASIDTDDEILSVNGVNLRLTKPISNSRKRNPVRLSSRKHDSLKRIVFEESNPDKIYRNKHTIVSKPYANALPVLPVSSDLENNKSKTKNSSEFRHYTYWQCDVCRQYGDGSCGGEFCFSGRNNEPN